jgi:hypothetical protein
MEHGYLSVLLYLLRVGINPLHDGERSFKGPLVPPEVNNFKLEDIQNE